MKKLTIVVLLAFAWAEARAVTNVFFNASQTATVISSNLNVVTIRSGAYLFTHTVDGYWSPYQGGPPTGRFFSVFWPTGIHAQALTAGPSVGIGANIIIKRVDGKLFDLRAFTGKLLANTAGTGGAFEIMPLLDGEDALNDPLMFNCSGYGGQSFPHTPMLTGYDTYKIHLWVDWAITALTLIDTNPVASQPPVACGGAFFQLTGQPLAINLADLIRNDYDPDGDPVSFTSVSATSSNGLALTTNATQILVPANALADGFHYTISDGHGGTATGAATIAIITNVTSQVLLLDVVSAPGLVTVNFSGVPWYDFECQRAMNFTFTGTLQTWPTQAGPDGAISITGDFSDLGGQPSQAFYRLRYLP